MFLKQLQVGHMAIFAYIVGDKETGDALVIDPAAETERIVAERRRTTSRSATSSTPTATWTTSRATPP